MSGDRLTFSQILLLTAYAVGMTAGQLLFKMAANSYAIADGGCGDFFITFIFFQRSYCTPALLFYGYGFLASHLYLEPIRS